MTIQALLKAVPAPDAPWEAFSGSWHPVEAALGTKIPPDYIEYCRIYGSGYFMKFLGIRIPYSSNRNIQLVTQSLIVRDVYEKLEPLDPYPYPFWPEPGGLLSFGGTDNGDDLFWLMRGSPEDWPVVVRDRGTWQFELFECDLTGFLAGLATGTFRPKEFPELLPCDAVFQPNPPWTGPISTSVWTR